MRWPDCTPLSVVFPLDLEHEGSRCPSVRILNALGSAGVYSLGDLRRIATRPYGLRSVRGFGSVSVDWARRQLAAAWMHRAASAVEAEGIDSKATLSIVDGNRAIADTLAAAADRLVALERFEANLAKLNRLEWLTGVTIHEMPRRLPAAPTWKAMAAETPGAAAHRGVGDDERLFWTVESPTMFGAVARLAEIIESEPYQWPPPAAGGGS